MSIKSPNIGILGFGDMGSAMACVLYSHNVGRILTTCENRGQHTRELVSQANIEVLNTLADLVSACDVFLSIVPTSSSFRLAIDVCKSNYNEKPFIYVDCNAITPEKSEEIWNYVTKKGLTYIDACIIGPPPTSGKIPTLYTSGPKVPQVLNFDGMGIKVRHLGEQIGLASGLKMLFSALNKGFNALALQTYTAAVQLGLESALDTELKNRISCLKQRIDNQLPFIPIKAKRWVDEMIEISTFMAKRGLPADFHKSAAEMFDIASQTPFSIETRQTFNNSRTPIDVAKACLKVIPKNSQQQNE